jgi:putative flippase GtrA
MLKVEINKIFDSRFISYSIIGGINSIFGYIIGVGLYLLLDKKINIILIGILITILSITFSFTTLKIFVFKSKGNWLTEYIRAYVVYGSISIINLIFWCFLIHFNYGNIFIAQAVVIMNSFILSYFSHTKYTFKGNRPLLQRSQK